MKVTTKRGDDGCTILCKGCKEKKCSAKIEAVGDIDELISLLGVCSCYDDITTIYLEEIQAELSLICSELALRGQNCITEKHVQKLDHYINKVSSEVKIPQYWFYGGDNKRASWINYARAVTRRCERSVVKLYDEGHTKNKSLLIYLNRLSDLLYLLIFLSPLETGRVQCPKQ